MYPLTRGSGEEICEYTGNSRSIKSAYLTNRIDAFIVQLSVPCERPRLWSKKHKVKTIALPC